jgi:hypothetical protein
MPIPKDNTCNNITNETHPMNPIIDFDTCQEPIDHDLNKFDWSKDLSLLRRDEEELLRPNAWLTNMHMNAAFILLYRAKFQQISYKPHHYSFTETNAIYHGQCMQYINVHGNHWILCHNPPLNICIVQSTIL